ncbi:MAG: SagB/ThcOx family dehydrogenase [Dysgonamonadaceae bacterium]|jgi:SagB-type dehydrogenase family enzyme|nr:SagB/ThcOx family dehydrogenase [Dysgonamonadaceae bacterium]
MKQDIYNLFYDQGLNTESLDFIERSKMTTYNSMNLGMRIGSIMQIPYYSKQVANHTTELGMCEKIPLQKTFNETALKLRDIQLVRKSTRKFNKFINLENLSNVLLNSYFVTEIFKDHSHHLARRSIASGGALYPIDLYYISLHTEGLENGTYFYNLHNESLDCLVLEKEEKNYMTNLLKAFPEEIKGEWDFSTVSGIIIFGAVINRVACKYGDRGLRFALMDVGAILQNIHLASAAENIDCCAIGGYIDDAIDSFLHFRYPDAYNIFIPGSDEYYIFEDLFGIQRLYGNSFEKSKEFWKEIKCLKIKRKSMIDISRIIYFLLSCVFITMFWGIFVFFISYPIWSRFM